MLQQHCLLLLSLLVKRRGMRGLFGNREQPGWAEPSLGKGAGHEGTSVQREWQSKCLSCNGLCWGLGYGKSCLECCFRLLINLELKSKCGQKDLSVLSCKREP